MMVMILCFRVLKVKVEEKQAADFAIFRGFDHQPTSFPPFFLPKEINRFTSPSSISLWL